MEINENTNLTQYIIVANESKNDPDINAKVARAPIALISRCFKGCTSFVGNTETKFQQKAILHWINKCNQQVNVIYVDAMYIDSIVTLGEMIGATSSVIGDNENPHVAAIGPWCKEELTNLIKGATGLDI